MTTLAVVAMPGGGSLPTALADAALATVLGEAMRVDGSDLVLVACGPTAAPPAAVRVRSVDPGESPWCVAFAASEGAVLAVAGNAPEITSALLGAAFEHLRHPGVAVIGHSLDSNGIWALGLAGGASALVAGSSLEDISGADLEQRLQSAGLRIERISALHTVTTVEQASAAVERTPGTPFAATALALSLPARARPSIPVERPAIADLFEPFERYRMGPLKAEAFTSRLHSERTAALLGLALGLAFSVCFLTGVYSHVSEFGPGWAQRFVPASPAWLYRVTQGIHIVSGMIAIPLLLAKLWTVYPRFWGWPPIRSSLHAIERISLIALVGGAVFQLATGLMNIFYWYAFPFNFVPAHWAGAWVAIGGLIVHIGAKWEVARRALPRRPAEAVTPVRARSGLSRRGFLAVTAAAGGTILATTIGSTSGTFSWAAILAPRRAGDGPQGVPTNHLANGQIRAAARAEGYELEVVGAVKTPLRLSLADLRAMPLADEQLAISCVEGWSTSARWRGIPVRDLLDRAGAAHGAHVRVESLQESGGYRSSILRPSFARNAQTLLALELNGETLHIDHGYPVRLIAPNRPGVHQTKWVARLVVL